MVSQNLPETSEAANTEIVQLTQQEYQNLQKLAQRGSQESSLIKEIVQNPEAVRGIVEIVASSWGTLQKGKFTYSLIRVGMVLLIIGVIIWAAASLTSSGRLDGSALTFLLGTITGYLLTFLTNIESSSD